MNEKQAELSRMDLKDGLAKCTEAEQLTFKRMYANGDLDLPINDVVDRMPADRLEWAMEQVGRTLMKKVVK